MSLTDTSRHPSARAIPFWLLPLLGCLPFVLGLGGAFVLDDFVNLVGNSALRVTWGDSFRAWLAAAWSSPAGGLDRPLTMLTFALDNALWGMDAGAWKRSSLMLHALNALLTFILVRELLRSVNILGRPAQAFAGLVALAWAVHPLQVSTVLYVVQRMEVLGHTFTLLTLLCYVRARQRMIRGEKGWLWLISAALIALLGLFAKETVIMAPALALAAELTLFRFRAMNHRDQLAIRCLSLAGVIVLGMAVAYLFWKYANPAAFQYRDFTWQERLLTEMRVLATYLRWIVVPIPTEYLFYYDFIPISTGLWSPSSTFFSLVLHIALLGSTVLLRKSLPLYAFGIAWFYLGQLITAGPVPLEIAFEHRNYGPMLGVLLAIGAVGLALVRSRADLRNVALLLALAFIALCAFGSSLRSWEWGDPIRFITNTATRAPQSARAQHNYGTTMILLTRFDGSDPMFHIGRNSILAATRLPGARPQAQAMLIEASARAGLPVAEEWWSALHDYLARHGVDHHAADSVLSLVTCRLGEDCPIDERRLQGLLADALSHGGEKNPDLLLAYADFAFRQMDDWDLAERLHRAAVAEATRSPHFRVSLATFLVRIGKLDDAERELTAADQMDKLDQYRDQRELIRRSIAAAREDGERG